MSKGIDFLFVDYDFNDCFSWWLDANSCLKKKGSIVEIRSYGNAKHWAREKQCTTLFLTNKNDTLAGFFCFCGCRDGKCSVCSLLFTV